MGLTDLPRLVLAPCFAQLSGALTLESADASRRIVYSGGWPISAASNVPSEQIEAQLVEADILTGAQLQKALALRASKKTDLQQALFDLKLLSKTSYVDQMVALRKSIVVNALSTPCQSRFEPVSADPVGFSFLPLLDCCAMAVAKWPPAEQKKTLTLVGTSVLTVHNAEMVMTLGAPQGLLSLLQRITREPRTCAQLYSTEPASLNELVVAIATGIIGSPNAVSLGEMGGLDAEIADALTEAQRKSRTPVWESALPVAMKRHPAQRAPLVLAVIASALVGSATTWAVMQRTTVPVAPVIVQPRAVETVEQVPTPSVLEAAGARAKDVEAKWSSRRLVLSGDETARVEELVARGNDQMKKNKLPAAIRDFRSALEIDPTAPQLHRSLAIAFTRNGDIEPAIFEYKVYLRLAPGAEDSESVKEIIEAYGKQIEK